MIEKNLKVKYLNKFILKPDFVIMLLVKYIIEKYIFMFKLNENVFLLCSLKICRKLPQKV